MVPTAGLAGAVLVAAANYAVQRWRYRIDRISASVDHFCEEVNSVAGLSTQYWLLDAERGDQPEVTRIEPQLVGRQMRLQSLILALRDLDKKLPLTGTEILLLDFYDVLTGGDFQVHGRAPSPSDAQRAQALAARINGELRQAVSSRSHFWF
jgi:hypothetical protein